MLLLSFLKLIGTICQQLFSQFSRFVSPLWFQYKIYIYRFTITFVLALNVLDPPQKKAMCLRLGFGCYKMILNTYVKFFSRYVGRWPWLGNLFRQHIVPDLGWIYLKTALIRELPRQAHLHWFVYQVTLEIGNVWIIYFLVRKLDPYYQ